MDHSSRLADEPQLRSRASISTNRSSSSSNSSDTSRSRGKKNGCRDATSRWTKNWAKKSFNKKQLHRKLPILEWLPQYDTEKAISDLIAGITVGLTTIPQGIAYALVAELPPQYGLYSAFMGCFVYLVFGSSKDITVGPTAIMSLMTAEHVKGKGVDLVVLLTFFTGIIIFLLGILRLGFVIDFVSMPVIAAFTSAAAITIASSQVMGLFGLTLGANNASEVVGITGTWIDIVNSFDTIRYQDTILGLTCIIVLLLMREMKDVKWFDDMDENKSASACQSCCFRRFSPRWRKILSKTIWVISTGRNAIVVLVCLGVAYAFDPVLPDDPKSRNTTFILTGKIESGMPPFKLPPFETEFDGETLDLGAMLQELGSAIAIIPIIAIIENMAIAKAFAGGKPVDASQEMIALGLANFMGSFVSSMPTTGSFSRTAVNASSGVRTTFGGIYTGTLVILALVVLMPACAYIPKATLAAVIITAVIFSIEYEMVMPMYRSKKSDLFVFFVAFMACTFWALEMGILVGVAVNSCFVMYYTARPNLQLKEEQLSGIPGSEYLVVTIDRALLFPSINYVRNLINKAGLRQGKGSVPLVVDCEHIFTADFTGAEGFLAMAADFKKRRQPILFCNVGSKVEDTFVGPVEEGHEGLVIVHSRHEMLRVLAELFAKERTEDGVVVKIDLEHQNSIKEERNDDELKY